MKFDLKSLKEQASKLAKDTARKAEDAIKANGGEQILNDARNALDKTVTAGKKALEENKPAIDKALGKAAEGLEKAAKTVEEADAKIEQAVETGKAEAKKIADKFKPKG